jgi:arylsulfatase A-like enzyme
VLVAAIAGCGRGAPPAPPRNVLLVTLDTTRADHLGCYGRAPSPTPTIDRLAREGARFERVVAQSALTPVSHASILTGRNPQSHGLRVIAAGSGDRLPDAIPTLATLLDDAGFDTAAVLSSFTVSEHFGLARGFGFFDNGLARSADGLLQPTQQGALLWDVRRNQRRADATTDAAIAWLARARAPFLLWVHYWDPHDELVLPPPELVERFAAGRSGADRARAIYEAEVHYVDAQLGRLIDALGASGALDQTLIAVSADHGQGLGDHDWWHHRILYQEQIRLPLVLRGPGIEAGTSVAPLVRSIDLLPTLLELLGVAAPPGLDGRSALGLLRGALEPARSAYAESLAAYDRNAALVRERPRDGVLHALIEPPWKLVYRPDSRAASELYDLDTDPREQTNRFAAESAVAARLIDAIEKSGGLVPDPGVFAAGTLDPEAAERLRALGYVGEEPKPPFPDP